MKLYAFTSASVTESGVRIGLAKELISRVESLAQLEAGQVIHETAHFGASQVPQPCLNADISAATPAEHLPNGRGKSAPGHPEPQERFKLRGLGWSFHYLQPIVSYRFTRLSVPTSITDFDSTGAKR